MTFTEIVLFGFILFCLIFGHVLANIRDKHIEDEKKAKKKWIAHPQRKRRIHSAISDA